MTAEFIWYLVLLGITHWILAILLLEDLVARPQVVGGRKAPWAASIVFLTVAGSLFYLLAHPQIIAEEFYAAKEVCRERYEK
ncbi:MAG: hypothetical protein V1849_02225 [Chloroflexota bacterium]